MVTVGVGCLVLRKDGTFLTGGFFTTSSLTVDASINFVGRRKSSHGAGTVALPGGLICHAMISD